MDMKGGQGSFWNPARTGTAVSQATRSGYPDFSSSVLKCFNNTFCPQVTKKLQFYQKAPVSCTLCPTSLAFCYSQVKTVASTYHNFLLCAVLLCDIMFPSGNQLIGINSVSCLIQAYSFYRSSKQRRGCSLINIC